MWVQVGVGPSEREDEGEKRGVRGHKFHGGRIMRRKIIRFGVKRFPASYRGGNLASNSQLTTNLVTTTTNSLTFPQFHWSQRGNLWTADLHSAVTTPAAAAVAAVVAAAVAAADGWPAAVAAAAVAFQVFKNNVNTP